MVRERKNKKKVPEGGNRELCGRGGQGQGLGGSGRVGVGGVGGNRELCYTSSVWSSQDVCTAWLIGYRRLRERHRRTRLATRFFCLILNAAVDAVGPDGHTPLLLVCMQGSVAVAAALLAAALLALGADPSKRASDVWFE